MFVRNLVGLGTALLLTATAFAQHDAKAAAKVEVGQPAPTFELKGTDGKSYNLANYKDKIVVLEWFNKDCPVCKQQLATIKETSAKYQKQGVVWLAVDSTNSRKFEENVKAAQEESLPHPILADFDGVTGKAYGATNTPQIFVINKGKLAYTGALIEEKGTRNYTAEALDALIAGKDVPLAQTKAYGCTVKYKK